MSTPNATATTNTATTTRSSSSATTSSTTSCTSSSASSSSSTNASTNSSTSSTCSSPSAKPRTLHPRRYLPCLSLPAPIDCNLAAGICSATANNATNTNISTTYLRSPSMPAAIPSMERPSSTTFLNTNKKSKKKNANSRSPSQSLITSFWRLSSSKSLSPQPVTATNAAHNLCWRKTLRRMFKKK